MIADVPYRIGIGNSERFKPASSTNECWVQSQPTRCTQVSNLEPNRLVNWHWRNGMNVHYYACQCANGVEVALMRFSVAVIEMKADIVSNTIV
jgi:hypothetical protein